MIQQPMILRVALPVPLYRLFDYVFDQNNHSETVQKGARVLVPFGKRQLVGVVTEILSSQDSKIQKDKLKPIQQVLDGKLISSELLELGKWVASYYLVPFGLAYELFLPIALRKGMNQQPEGEQVWHLATELSALEKENPQLLNFGRAHSQKALFEFFQDKNYLSKNELNQGFKNWRTAMKALTEKGIVESSESLTFDEYQPRERDQLLSLTSEQKKVVENVLPSFSCHLIYGVTGSGKTEVYLSIVENFLAEQNAQALLLVPEISLTPQFVDRVRKRLNKTVAVVHSGLNDKQRHKAWWSAKNGKVDIILGTRASVFTEFKNLKLIIVDEEHDASFKQQDGVRYHARDVAIMRAKQYGIPIVMGSATPSFESLENAQNGKFELSRLEQRATGQKMPDMHIIDISDPNQKPVDGLSPALIKQIEQRLKAKQQCILFVNRRGYSPTLYCTECGWIAQCPRCDARLTAHINQKTSLIQSVRCHHCGYQSGSNRQTFNQCGACNQQSVLPLGLGTQRSEDALSKLFPQAVISRMDRDVITNKTALEKELKRIQNQEVHIILGTQMLAKGHDFPNVTLVGILDADHGLFAIDFRGPEKLYQQLMQISGRAGRHQHGDVFIQTNFPEHTFFQQLLTQDYITFAEAEFQSRQLLNYPPAGYLSLLRAESTYAKQGVQFLNWCRQQLPIPEDVFVSDAVPAPMEKRAGRYRAQLLMQSSSRAALHQFQHQLISIISESKQQQKIRWSLDVDPVDMY